MEVLQSQRLEIASALPRVTTAELPRNLLQRTIGNIPLSEVAVAGV
jgi:hypothetical protein